MRSFRRVAVAVSLVLAASGLPARADDEAAPEIVGVEYKTQVSGAGVISAQDDVDPFDLSGRVAERLGA